MIQTTVIEKPAFVREKNWEPADRRVLFYFLAFLMVTCGLPAVVFHDEVWRSSQIDAALDASSVDSKGAGTWAREHLQWIRPAFGGEEA